MTWKNCIITTIIYFQWCKNTTASQWFFTIKVKNTILIPCKPVTFVYCSIQSSCIFSQIVCTCSTSFTFYRQPCCISSKGRRKTLA